MRKFKKCAQLILIFFIFLVHTWAGSFSFQLRFNLSPTSGDNIEKREPTAIGSFGLPHPLHPIYSESSRIHVSVSPIFRNEVFQSGSLNESSNKANAYLFM